MRELVVVGSISLDGVMQAPGTPDEDGSGGFEHGGWLPPLWDDDLAAYLGETMGKPFDLVLGRRTYDILAAYWPSAPAEAGAGPLNEATKYVASRSAAPDLPWQHSQLLGGDVAEAVAALKRDDGPELQVHGSGDLIRTLWGAGLIDRFRLVIAPIVLGRGKRLFDAGSPAGALRLVSSRTTGKGVTMATYEPAGPVASGSFAG
ncbi:dihydrofolate reductase family protein [Actinoplanes sp. TRM 88003]|uniref:Dihydrofolate reductase family protein n=1 Tax=Paractinoplanes aksuensis TaxID=2939490 RepID=A0ABT1DYL4_9ACTN|nr:dihydrofolate reductase family protein [Actinoplanes aksuensis]MCO8275850.1 dihydrofolate reductase family protein [Actinoplanes aksuensis]